MAKDLMIIALVLIVVFFLASIAPRLFSGPKTAGDVAWEQVNPAKAKEQHKKIIKESKSDYKDFMDKQRSLR